MTRFALALLVALSFTPILHAQDGPKESEGTVGIPVRYLVIGGDALVGVIVLACLWF